MVMKKSTYIFEMIVVILSLISYQVVAQTSGPRKPPTTRSPAPATPGADRSMPTDNDSPAEAKVINGFEVTLLEIKGSSVSQTVIATMRIKNPGGNTEICTQQAYAVDMDGNQYQSMSGRSCAPLFTDVPLKWTQGVKGIPSKVKTLALLTFGLYNKTTRKTEIAEFRDLTINWQ